MGTSATSVLSRCGIFNTITHHTPVTTQLNTLLTRQRQTRATSRDADLAAKVEEEIEAESEQSRPIPKIRGFELERTSGTTVTLTSDGNDERITVSFDVNQTSTY